MGFIPRDCTVLIGILFYNGSGGPAFLSHYQSSNCLDPGVDSIYTGVVLHVLSQMERIPFGVEHIWYTM